MWGKSVKLLLKGKTTNPHQEAGFFTPMTIQPEISFGAGGLAYWPDATKAELEEAAAKLRKEVNEGIYLNPDEAIAYYFLLDDRAKSME